MDYYSDETYTSKFVHEIESTKRDDFKTFELIKGWNLEDEDEEDDEDVERNAELEAKRERILKAKGIYGGNTYYKKYLKYKIKYLKLKNLLN